MTKHMPFRSEKIFKTKNPRQMNDGAFPKTRPWPNRRSKGGGTGAQRDRTGAKNKKSRLSSRDFS
jgi:hypothetical protein